MSYKHEEVPLYYWYTAKHYPNHFRTVWHNGMEYVALSEEASYEDIEKYDLREIGIGDSRYLEGVK